MATSKTLKIPLYNGSGFQGGLCINGDIIWLCSHEHKKYNEAVECSQYHLDNSLTINISHKSSDHRYNPFSKGKRKQKSIDSVLEDIDVLDLEEVIDLKYNQKILELNFIIEKPISLEEIIQSDKAKYFNKSFKAYNTSNDIPLWDEQATEHLSTCKITILEKISYGFIGKDITNDGEEVEIYGDKYIVNCLCGEYNNTVICKIKNHLPYNYYGTDADI